MDAFKQQHRSGFQLQPFAVVFADARNEVILRHFDFLAVEQGEQVALQGLVIDGVEIVEVVGAVGQFGRVHAIDKIVVSGEGNGLQTTSK